MYSIGAIAVLTPHQSEEGSERRRENMSFVAAAAPVANCVALRPSLISLSNNYISSSRLGLEYLPSPPLLLFPERWGLLALCLKKTTLVNDGWSKCKTNMVLACSTSTPITTPIIKTRKRYRKLYPGESTGIVEEMRFVAMKLRTRKERGIGGAESSNAESEGEGDTWHPTIEGFLKYLVDSRLVFRTLETVVDESNHVAYAYFRKTGLERSDGLSKDIEWFSQQGFVIPESSPPGTSYAKYLEEIAEKSAPTFLCHFYNMYFAHITGGQVIGKQVSEKILGGRELEFYKWEGVMPELLRDVRDNLNRLSEYWSRDEKNKCLREAAKSFRYSGQIVRLIIL